MNNLNSILLEGTIKGGLDTRTDGVCAFVLESRRKVKGIEGRDSEGVTTYDGTREEVCFFNIETTGRLADVCFEYLKPGRGVRVVGRLVQELRPDETGYARSYVFIHADHVEFKPTAAKRAEEHAEAVAL